MNLVLTIARYFISYQVAKAFILVNKIYWLSLCCCCGESTEVIKKVFANIKGLNKNKPNCINANLCNLINCWKSNKPNFEFIERCDLHPNPMALKCQLIKKGSQKLGCYYHRLGKVEQLWNKLAFWLALIFDEFRF